MRLKKLILHGFKSFADRTEFVFDRPITGIVGPNGCGKSNVVDGFKWVLGEQSAKSLRGDAMMDVIFNGSGNRKPAGLAEVTLVFENPLRADNTRHLALESDEVSVGRRLYRDGTSEYQINNTTSRLKDVRELFLDTGVGVDAYSVIEQGRVAALLEANPEERRLIFEEAAGISKYKAKKKEAQRKLERVDQNLLRVTDIVEEVEKRLRSVKVQAGRARTYQEHSVRLSELRLSYALQEYHTLSVQIGELTGEQEAAQFQLDDATGDLQRSQNELGTAREQAEAISQHRQRTEYELVQAQAQVQSAKQRQQYARQQLAQIAEQIAQHEHDRNVAEEKLAAAKSAFETESGELQRLTKELEESRQAIEQKQQAFRDGQLRLNQAAAEIEKAKSSVLDLMRKISQLSSRLSSIEIERRNISQQQTRLADRRRVVTAESESLETRRVDLQQALDGVLANIQSQQLRQDVCKQQAESLGKQIATLSEQIGTAKEHRSGLASRQNLLRDLEARREGVSEGVQSVLRRRGEEFAFIRGLVADAMRVDVEHARVIEAALDGRDQWLVASESAAVLASSEALEALEGRVNVLCLDELAKADAIDAYDWNTHAIGVRLAADLVRYEETDAPLVRGLLGRTAIVDTLAEAGELHRAGPAGWRYATMSGDVMEADGTVRAGPLSAAMGLLSRRSELDAIGTQIVEIDERIARLTSKLTDDSAAAKSLEEQMNAVRTEMYQSNTQRVEVTSQIATSNDKLNSLSREMPVLDRELSGLLEQMSRLSDEEQRLKTNLQTAEADQAQKQEQIQSGAAMQAELQKELSGASEALTSARVALGQVQEKQLASQQHVQRHQLHVNETTQQIERLVRAAETVSGRQGDIEREIAEAEHQERTLQQKQATLTEESKSLAERLGEAQKSVSKLASDVESIRERFAEAEQTLHRLQIQLSESRVRTESLVQRTRDEIQLDLPERYAQGYEPAEMDWEAVAQEIKELREKIQRLGNVNLDAIGEQDELEQREQFLTGQVNDLRSSQQQLQELIDTINRESSTRFEETFNTVREHFQAMFRKLFGGGKADIYLETELEAPRPTKAQVLANAIANPDGVADEGPKTIKVDVLDAGIEIIARPPGKQPVSISQLSGGEKAMTCIALLMSIFKSKPSPFCILDEVDAPLDEANNQRFGLIIQEFLATSQFIVITHHKRTMQIANTLYGVTMQEQGVSKRVAVNFDQVDHQGRISAEAAAAADAEEDSENNASSEELARV